MVPRQVGVAADPRGAGVEPTLARPRIQVDLLGGAPPQHVAEPSPPRVRIRSLGEFVVLVNDVPLRCAGRVPRKSWELLQALVALGAADVPQNALAQALWPDSDGDAAQHALEVRVHRLRALIGRQCIVVENGRVGLDPRRCWLDVWELERVFEALDDALRSEGDAEQIHALIGQIQVLYKGPFLGHDSHSWLLPLRERIRSRYLRAVDRVAARFEDAEGWREGVELLVRGLELDPFIETFYRRAMLSYQKHGRRAEALSIWRRCQRALSAGLGISPSPETEVIALQLQQPTFAACH